VVAAAGRVGEASGQVWAALAGQHLEVQGLRRRRAGCLCWASQVNLLRRGGMHLLHLLLLVCILHQVLTASEGSVVAPVQQELQEEGSQVVEAAMG
jgi:hypothetical protein